MSLDWTPSHLNHSLDLLHISILVSLLGFPAFHTLSLVLLSVPNLITMFDRACFWGNTNVTIKIFTSHVVLPTQSKAMCPCLSEESRIRELYLFAGSTRYLIDHDTTWKATWNLWSVMKSVMKSMASIVSRPSYSCSYKIPMLFSQRKVLQASVKCFSPRFLFTTFIFLGEHTNVRFKEKSTSKWRECCSPAVENLPPGFLHFLVAEAVD